MSASQESKLAETPAYASHVSYRNFTDSIGAAGPLPTQINKSVMATLNHGTRTALMATLRSLHLIGEGDRPTELFEALVAARESDDDRKKVMQQILRASYPYLFDGSINLERASSGELFDKFRAATKATGTTIDKAVNFFLLAANDAGLPLSPHLAKGRPGASMAPKRAKAKRGRNRQANGETPPAPALPVQERRVENGSDPMDRLLDKFPSFDPNWTVDMQSKWFNGFDLLAKRIGPARGAKKPPSKE